MNIKYKYIYIFKVLSFSIKVLSNSSRFLEGLQQLIYAYQYVNKKDTANVEYKIFIQNRGNDKHIIIRNGEIVYKTLDHVDLLLTLIAYFQEDFIDSIEDHYLLHSALMVKNGRAIVLPAARKSGKSTLSMALLKYGFKYLSDEITAIHQKSLRTSGFPRAIILRDKTLSLFHSLEPEITYRIYKSNNSHKSREIHVGIPSKMSMASKNKSFPISAIVFPKYNPKGITGLNEINSSSAVFNLMQCSLNQNRFKEKYFRLAARLVRHTKYYNLQINDLDQACEIINRII